MKVVVADDEWSISDAVAYALRREGFEVQTAADGAEALRLVEAFDPHVLVLDVMMPVMSGYDVCRALLGRRGLGILLMTVKNDIVDKVLGLELGADDYMTKPFDVRELVARVKALARRVNMKDTEKTAAMPVGTIRNGPLTVIPERRSASLKGRELELTPKEFDLLVLLVGSPHKVFRREDMLALVWEMDYAGGTRTVDIHVQRLRRKLGEIGQHLIQTVYGIGYKAIEL